MGRCKPTITWSQSCQTRATSAKPLPTRSSQPLRAATCCSGVVQNPDLIGSPLVLERHRQPDLEPNEHTLAALRLDVSRPGRPGHTDQKPEHRSQDHPRSTHRTPSFALV